MDILIFLFELKLTCLIKTPLSNNKKSAPSNCYIGSLFISDVNCEYQNLQLKHDNKSFELFSSQILCYERYFIAVATVISAQNVLFFYTMESWLKLCLHIRISP